MRKSSAYIVAILANLWVMPSLVPAADEIVVEQTRRGIPVQTAILTRRYGAVETEDEVAAEELEAGVGATNIFKSVHWRRWYGPRGWYGGFYGPGPGYYVGYRPRYYGYYPPYYGGYYGAPYVSYYAPRPAFYGGYGYGGYGYGGYGGCYYW